ncbi:MAG: hypothetical protein OXF05_00845 [Hyphomicrobiales bacterium]|nr:hypothetical protein [Hyphomicrobiales bacterium]
MSTKLSEFNRIFECNIKRRRKFSLPEYKNLTEACNGDFDGEYVTPLQIEARSATGPCLIAHNWLDAKRLEEFCLCPEKYRLLKKHGYAPWIPFNQILDLALERADIRRQGTYMTQAFHLLPLKGKPKPKDVQKSFERITQHEVRGRNVVALGVPAQKVCKKFGIAFLPAPHPSDWNIPRHKRVADIAEAIKGAR